MFVSLVALGGSLQFLKHRAQANRDREASIERAIAEIEKIGGAVYIAYDEPRTQTWLEKQFDDPGDLDDPVRGVKGISVTYYGDIFSDEGLKHLEALPNVKMLMLRGVKVTDAGLEHLRGMSDLRVLEISYTKLSGAGLRHLGELPNLEEIELRSVSFTGAGLEYLQGMSALRSLTIIDTEITVIALQHLKEFGRLERLELEGPQLSQTGMELLKELTQLRLLALTMPRISEKEFAQFRQMYFLKGLFLERSSASTDGPCDHFWTQIDLLEGEIPNTKINARCAEEI
jgi:hypothetical protein